MFNVIEISSGSRSNAPAIPDSKLIKDAKGANMALIVKITDACDKESRLRACLCNQHHNCEYNWTGKLIFSVST